MRKPFQLTLGLVALALIGILAAQVAPLFKDPRFEVINASPDVVFVVASWRNENKEIGTERGIEVKYDFEM